MDFPRVKVVIVSGVRTAIGNFGGTLKDISAVKLGSIVIKEALKRAGLKPVTSEKLQKYSPESLKGVSMTSWRKPTTTTITPCKRYKLTR